jgi:hypothetical protein
MENNKEKDQKNKKQKTKIQKYYSHRGFGQKKNKFYNSLFAQRKKIKNEIESMPHESRNTFREALNKYNFGFEVFIPNTLRVSKKEYKKKNYLLNTLISFEDKLREQKELINPLKKDNNRFSKQYKLIHKENTGHQRDYIKNLQDYYENIGYNRSGIEYKGSENIFTPSSILDQDFGRNIEEDAFKYSNAEYKTDFHKDQNLIKKWKKGIKDTKDNKNRAKKRNVKEENSNYKYDYENAEDNIEEHLLEIELEKEKEKQREEIQKELEEIKKNLMEESRIKNLSRKEYYNYSLDLKKDIKKAKESLEEFDNNNTEYLNLDNKLKKGSLKNLFTANSYRVSKTSTSKKNSILGGIRAKTDKKRISIHDYIFGNDNKTRNNDNLYSKKQAPLTMTENIRKFDKYKTCILMQKKESFPKINTTNSINNEINIFELDDELKEKIGKIKNEKLIKKIIQNNALDHLYKSVYINKKYFFERYPSKSVETYFKTYTNRRIPILNIKKGSNVHGLLDDLQHIVKKNDFYKIVESNSDVKKEINHKNEFSNRKLLDDKKFNVEKIQEMDVKIPDLHYQYAEELLSNQPTDNFYTKYK